MIYENRMSILLTLARLQVLNVVMYPSLINHIVDRLVNAVETAKGNPPPLHRPSHLKEYSFLKCFVIQVLHLSQVPIGTLLVGLAHIDQIKFDLGVDCGWVTYERVFVGSLMLANKFLEHDGFTFKPLERTRLMFDKAELDAIEAQFSVDFGFRLMNITKESILTCYGIFVDIALTDKLCHKAGCQPHEHRCMRVSQYCSSFAEPEDQGDPTYIVYVIQRH
ncbi:hypothetical protein J3A83DRAFT_4185059 [Scleroderma citrinum]